VNLDFEVISATKLPSGKIHLSLQAKRGMGQASIVVSASDRIAVGDSFNLNNFSMEKFLVQTNALVDAYQPSGILNSMGKLSDMQ
jgi:hypothetical protein